MVVDKHTSFHGCLEKSPFWREIQALPHVLYGKLCRAHAMYAFQCIPVKLKAVVKIMLIYILLQHNETHHFLRPALEWMAVTKTTIEGETR